MSLMGTRIYKQLEALRCRETQHCETECHCATLKRHYGTKIFKCWFPSCSFSRQGFDTHTARDTHIKSEDHARPYKCSVSGCEFAVIGFSTRRDASNHCRTRHNNPKPNQTYGDHDQLSHDELKQILFDFTKAENVDGIQRLAPYIVMAEGAVRPAMLLAARKGSLPLIKALGEWSTSWPDNEELYGAIMNSENPDLMVWFLNRLFYSERGSRPKYGWLARGAVSTNSPDMYAAWEDYFLDPERGLKISYPYYSKDTDGKGKLGRWEGHHLRYSIANGSTSSPLCSRSAFAAAKKNILFEVRLVQTWHRLINTVLNGGPLNREFLGRALSNLARSCNHSITLAAELLRLGAPIDFPRGLDFCISKISRAAISQQQEQQQQQAFRRQYKPKGMTVLHYAVRGTSEQSAQFVKFLLERGASPGYGYARREPAMERGVALLQKWLGETWEELLERTQGARLEKHQKWKTSPGELSDNDQDDDGEEGEEEDEEDEEDEGDNEGGEGEDEGGTSDRKGKGRAKRRKLDHYSVDEEEEEY